MLCPPFCSPSPQPRRSPERCLANRLASPVVQLVYSLALPVKAVISNTLTAPANSRYRPAAPDSTGIQSPAGARS